MSKVRKGSPVNNVKDDVRESNKFAKNMFLNNYHAKLGMKAGLSFESELSCKKSHVSFNSQFSQEANSEDGDVKMSSQYISTIRNSINSIPSQLDIKRNREDGKVVGDPRHVKKRSEAVDLTRASLERPNHQLNYQVATRARASSTLM